MYTLRTNCIETNESFDSGVYETVEAAAKLRFADDKIVPVSDKEARNLILGSIYDWVCVAYSEEGLDEEDDDGEIQNDMFDDEVADYIKAKRPGWQLLLDYDHDRDNYFVVL